MPSDQDINICFDLGKKCTGFAIMRGYELLRYGRYGNDKASDAELFTRTYALCKSLVEWCEERELVPTRICFEAAEQQKGRANEIYFAMATALKVFGAKRDLPLAKVYSSSIKYYVAGHGHAEKGDVVDAVNRRYGLTLSRDAKRSQDHNVADAIGVGMTVADPDLRSLKEVA